MTDHAVIWTRLAESLEQNIHICHQNIATVLILKPVPVTATAASL